MARIEWVRARLENWARWCAQQDGGGLGYPSQTAFARLGGKGSRSEAVVPISSLDASEIDSAVKSLRLTQDHLYKVLTLTYAQGLPRHLVARKMGRAESTISANLEAGDRAIARWLQDKREAQQAAEARHTAPPASRYASGLA